MPLHPPLATLFPYTTLFRSFSRANPQRLVLPIVMDPEYQYESLNVETQQNNPSSLLWWMKRILSLRKRRSEEHTSELQSLRHLVCRLLLEKKNYEANQRIYD